MEMEQLQALLQALLQAHQQDPLHLAQLIVDLHNGMVMTGAMMRTTILIVTMMVEIVASMTKMDGTTIVP